MKLALPQPKITSWSATLVACLYATWLASYDRIELSSSAGKDSAAMAAIMVAIARACGLLDRVVIVHADLGRVEWPGTRELAERHAAALGVRFIVVARMQGDLLDHVEAMGKWPTPTTRYCTADHKRGQIHRVFTQLADELRLARPHHFGDGGRAPRILNCIGLRAEESPGRAKRPTLTRDARASSSRKIVDVYLPIQRLTEEEVWITCRASGLEMHPAYAAGLPRASCVFCIYAPRDALIIAGKRHPELLAQYVRVEKKIGHDFKHHLPMLQIAEAIEAGEEAGPVTNWVM